MKILFYKQANGKSPVNNFITKLHPKDKLKILACLKNIEELGLAEKRMMEVLNDEELYNA